MRELTKDDGMTLLEVLLAAIITAVISVVIVSITMGSAATLSRHADESIATAQVVTLYQNLRQDFSAASDAYFYGTTYPSDTSHLCSSATSRSWSALGSGFIRTLASIPVTTFNYDTSSNSVSNWLYPVTVYQGYEVRYNAADSAYEMWHVWCNLKSDGTVDRPYSNGRMYLSLGPNFDPSKGGTDLFTCDGAICPANASTSTTVVYKFNAPLTQKLGTNYGSPVWAKNLDDINILAGVGMSRKVNN